MAHSASRRERSRGSHAANEPLGPEGGFELIARDRYLFWIAVLIVLLNVVNTTGQYVLNR
jgi:AAA family ATP:ADP antiporter